MEHRRISVELTQEQLQYLRRLVRDDQTNPRLQAMLGDRADVLAARGPFNPLEETWDIRGWGVWLCEGDPDRPIGLFIHRPDARDLAASSEIAADKFIAPFSARVTWLNELVLDCTCGQAACKCGPDVPLP